MYRLDELVFTSARERINIEIQVNDYQNMPERGCPIGRGCSSHH